METKAHSAPISHSSFSLSADIVINIIIADTYHGSLPFCIDRRGEEYPNQWRGITALFYIRKLYTTDAN